MTVACRLFYIWAAATMKAMFKDNFSARPILRPYKSLCPDVADSGQTGRWNNNSNGGCRAYRQ